jgi:hypothetical protein
MGENKNKHLCKMVRKDYLKENLKEYAEIVKNPKYICTKCGRVSVAKKYLCKPKELA